MTLIQGIYEQFITSHRFCFIKICPPARVVIWMLIPSMGAGFLTNLHSKTSLDNQLDQKDHQWQILLVTDYLYLFFKVANSYHVNRTTTKYYRVVQGWKNIEFEMLTCLWCCVLGLTKLMDNVLYILYNVSTFSFLKSIIWLVEGCFDLFTCIYHKLASRKNKGPRVIVSNARSCSQHVPTIRTTLDPFDLANKWPITETLTWPLYMDYH